MITAARLAYLLNRHVRDHGDGPVQAYHPAGTAPHGTHGVEAVEAEQDGSPGVVATLRLGGGEA